MQVCANAQVKGGAATDCVRGSRQQSTQATAAIPNCVSRCPPRVPGESQGPSFAERLLARNKLPRY